MANKLRLSPSGPAIGDAGPGLLVRTVQIRGRIESPQLIGAQAAIGTIEAELPNATPGMRYSASLYCDVQADASVSTALAVQLFIQRRDNADANWVSVVQEDHSIGGANSVRQMRADVPITLGVDSPWLIPDGGLTSLKIRGSIQSSNTTNLSVSSATADGPNIYLEIKEYA